MELCSGSILVLFDRGVYLAAFMVRPMKTVYYKQCSLETDDGRTHYQCWLPTRYAVKGKKVRITRYPHTLWNITTVFPTAISEESLRNYGEAHRYHRQVTDI